MIDENEFFRQATLRICGRLDIEVALQNCLRYLTEFIPVDSMSLHTYERGLGAMRTIALATPSECHSIDQITSLPPDARESLETGPLPPVKIVNRRESDPVSREMARAFQRPYSSTLLMHLSLRGKEMGALAVDATGGNRYSEHDAHLLSLLNEPFAIAMANALRHRRVLRLKDMLTDDNKYLYRELLGRSGGDIVGTDSGLRGVMDMVGQVAPLNSPVLLLGETGVGKELIASAIHHSSPRRDGPFITVNSGAIPETLVDSELFGHEKGAFTGAIEQKRGRFERADGGTIFLDEIGELPLHAQVRMLRVIQEHRIERVGGSESVSVDIRVIAATHRDLPGMVRDKQFREDLLFRLNVFPITVPPLRERNEDIPALVRHFIEEKTRDLRLHSPPKLAPGSIDTLMAYHWPGNVRELENVVERALILHQDGELRFDRFVPSRGSAGQTAVPAGEQDTLTLDEMMARHIRRVLAKTGGRVHGPEGAAKLLGINASTLRNRMNRLGIPYGRRASD